MDDTGGRRRRGSRRGGAGRTSSQAGPASQTDRGLRPPTDPGSDPRAADADADPHSVARAIALRQLTMAPRSRAQLRQAMDRKLVPADVAEQVLGRLGEVNLVDDAAFAEGYVRYRQRERGLARRALAYELRSKGVDDETASAALEELDPEAETEVARELVRRKLKATRGLDSATRIRRLSGMLARKGYPAGTAITVVRDALAAEGEDLGDDEVTPG
jgi:regulatory protein